jgi:hypothetical protein
MKNIFSRYFLLVLLVSFFFSKGSKAQCDNPSLQREGAYIGLQPGKFDPNKCPKELPFLGGGYAYIAIDGKEVCLVTNIVTKPNGGNLIYWPKNKPMNWSVQALLSSGYGFCGAPDNYFVNGNAGPDVYDNSSYAHTFNASEVGFYKIGAHVVLKEAGRELIYKTVFGVKILVGVNFVPCPTIPRFSFDENIFIHVCVVDCGGGGSITTQQCGDNILHRPANTADYEYFWQGTQCGTDDSNGDPTYPYTASGTYYLRGRNKATRVWGDCISIKADYNNGPSLSTPPVPTVNGNTCGNVTLTMPVTPGVTYYWQDEGCKNPGSTLKPATNPYPVDKPGTYYVSAYNGSCWSSCSAVTPVINAITLPTVTNAYACICDNVNPSTGKPDVTVHATPSAYANTCKWYTKTSVDPDPPVYSSDGTGLTKTFNTNSDEIHYVSSYNSTTNCESAKVPVYIKFKPCTKCIESFTPIPGKKYVISAWVKEQNSFDATTYNNGYLKVSFNGLTAAADKIFKASGEIIDGWQKIEESFTIDGNVDGIKIEMNNGGATGVVFFDDIRVFPFDANMISYVYDPVTLKLVAELDANNYATYYIYDDEGRLTKVKKETTNGVKTIKEGRANNVTN